MMKARGLAAVAGWVLAGGVALGADGASGVCGSRGADEGKCTAGGDGAAGHPTMGEVEATAAAGASDPSVLGGGRADAELRGGAVSGGGLCGLRGWERVLLERSRRPDGAGAGGAGRGAEGEQGGRETGAGAGYR